MDKCIKWYIQNGLDTDQAAWFVHVLNQKEDADAFENCIDYRECKTLTTELNLIFSSGVKSHECGVSI